MTNLQDIIGITNGLLDRSDYHEHTWVADVKEHFPAIAQAILEREDLKQYVIMLWGAGRGRQDDIPHLKEMMKTGLEEWMTENKELKEKLKIAVEHLHSLRDGGCGRHRNQHFIGQNQRNNCECCNVVQENVDKALSRIQ